MPAKQHSSAAQSLHGLQTATVSITCLTWNCGGLSNLRDEFFTWLDGQGYDIVFLQETWYTQSLEYTARGWHCICSGVGEDSKRAHAGVMTLLRASVFQQEYIRHHEHIPGRVLQVRAFCHGGWIDTLNLYQHVLGNQQQEEAIVQKRVQVWQKVRAVLGQIPRGHKLVVAGDLNCSLAPVAACTGTGMMIPTTASPDREELVALLQDFQLRAVNTYGRRGSCTYIHEGYKPARKSFIDYILVRQTGLGRHKTGIIRDWQVARWRQGGRHMPVWTMLSVRRYKAQKETIQSPWPNWKCKLLVQAIQEQPHLAQQYRERITQALQQAEEYDPKKMNDILLQAGQDIFRIRRPTASAPPWEEAVYVGQIRIMWGHYRSMRQAGMLAQTQRRTLGSIFSCWRHLTCFQKMRKNLQRRSRSMRRIRLAVLTRGADSQNRAGCTQAIFDLLRRVAPKQPRKRAQLRTKDGRLMSPAEEAEALCHFWMEVNGGPPPRQVMELGSFDISKEEVIEALQQLRANKSAPQHCAPHALWRLAAEPIANYMENCVFGRWREGQSSIPADWAAAWLVFLSKPGKVNSDPKSLRPIALLDPMGKAICGVLKQRLVPFLMQRLPLRKQHVYLGAVISYGAFEVQNAQHRKHAGQAAFARMRPTLMSQRALSLDKRLRLWRTIVVPTTMYSLGASGLTKQAYDLIRVMFVKQIRAMARSPRHLTEESDNSLLSRLGMVMQQQRNTIEATQRILQESGGEDFRTHPIIVQREMQLLEMVQALERPSATGQDATSKCQCDLCDKAFESEAALRSRKAKMHSAERMSAEPTAFDRQRRGTDGMPKCSGCGHAFERWADLQKHIEENHCQGKPPSEVSQVKSIFVVAQEGDMDIQALQRDGLTEALRQELQQHCSYCRQWFPNDRYVKQHWSRVHKSQSQQYIAAAKHWRRTQFGPIKDTCSWCKGQPAARSDHRDTCPVLFQRSMVWVMQHDETSLQVSDERAIDLSLPDSSQLRKWDLQCQICEVKVTARGLRKHMTQKHGELWQAVRPQVDKLCSAWSMGIQDNICQFCNSSYGTKNVHALSCHAITQTALARVRTLFESHASVDDHGPDGGAGGGADAGSVRRSQHRREAHADTAAGGGRRQEAAQAKRQRGTGQGMDGQKQKVPSQPRDIRTILRGRGGRHGGHDEAAMQGSGKAGGPF